MRLGWIFGVGGALTFLGFALTALPGPGVFLVGVGLTILLIGAVVSADRTMARRSGRSADAQRHRPYLVVAVLFWAVPVVLLLFGYLILPDHNSGGRCNGIGFGCVPSPKDSMVLVAVLFYPVCVVAGLLAMAVVAGTRALRQRSS